MSTRPAKTKNTLRIPRVVIDTTALDIGARVLLTPDAGHYLKHVMRLGAGDLVHLVVSGQGLFEAALEVQRKDVVAITRAQLAIATVPVRQVCLVFSPIKQQKMHFLVEKAVELGVTALWPALMDHSAVRDVNIARTEAVVREAMEQSERLSRPEVRPLQTLPNILSLWPAGRVLYVLMERAPENPSFFNALLSHGMGDVGIIVGPEGGFSASERALLMDAAQAGKVQLVSLGTEILRAETAAMAALSLVHLQGCSS